MSETSSKMLDAGHRVRPAPPKRGFAKKEADWWLAVKWQNNAYFVSQWRKRLPR